MNALRYDRLPLLDRSSRLLISKDFSIRRHHGSRSIHFEDHDDEHDDSVGANDGDHSDKRPRSVMSE